MAEKRTFTRLAVESVAVVASILIAFSLDAWWNEREVDGRLRVELLSVSEEMAANLELIDFQLDFNRRQITGAYFLIQLAEAQGSAALSLPDTIGWLATNGSPTLDLSLGAVDAVMASGGLQVIESPRLRISLAGLRDRVTDVREEQVVARDVQLALDEYLDGTGWIRVMAPLARSFWGQERVPGRAAPSNGEVTFRVDGRILDMIARRASWLSVSITEQSALRSELEEIRAMINSELSES